MFKWSRWLCIGSMILSAPMFLWPSLELYLLTLFGPQMIFFAVVHSYPTVALALYLSLPVFVLSFLLNASIVVSRRWTAGLAPLFRPAVRILSFQIFHGLALFFYDFWSTAPVVRIPVALAGLLLLFLLVFLPFIALLQAKAPAARSGANFKD